MTWVMMLFKDVCCVICVTFEQMGECVDDYGRSSCFSFLILSKEFLWVELVANYICINEVLVGGA